MMNTVAWRKLGTTLDHSLTAEEAMNEGLLGGWNVRKMPLYAELPVSGRVVVPDRMAVVRSSPVKRGQTDYLGVVGSGYEVVQNEEHAGLLNALVDESGAHFDTAGAIDGGKRVFITMKLPGHINIGGIDPIENYISAINDHTGSMSFTMMVTPVRVHNAATLNLAFENNSHVIRVRHTSGALTNLTAKAREALDISFDYLDGFQQQAEQLINTVMTQSQFEQIISREYGAPEGASQATRTRAERKVEEIFELFSEADTQADIRGTAWAGLNAITEWQDHFAPTRGDERDLSRAIKAIFDPKAKNRALNLMMAVV